MEKINSINIMANISHKQVMFEKRNNLLEILKFHGYIFIVYKEFWCIFFFCIFCSRIKSLNIVRVFRHY